MNRQTARLAQQESMPKKRNTLLQHTAVRPLAEHPSVANSSAAGLARDFTQVPVLSQAQLAGQNTTRSCPMSPQRCPFGGACHSCPPRVQAKLKIGQPGDRYEQEADRVAETVMRMPEPQVQRKGCSAPGCKDDEDKILQAKSTGSAGNAAQSIDHPAIQNVLSSPGQPLDAGTRSFMEPRFGQDFSGVRVHVGGEAAESARAVNARAYTVGRDVVFGEGQYAPGSDEGKRLVAHELVHVGQQSFFEGTVLQLDPIDNVPGTDYDSCVEQINEDVARCADTVNTACSLYGAGIAATGATIGALAGSAGLNPVTAGIGGLIGGVAGTMYGAYKYGKCVEEQNRGCRAAGAASIRKCREKFPAQ